MRVFKNFLLNEPPLICAAYIPLFPAVLPHYSTSSCPIKPTRNCAKHTTKKPQKSFLAINCIVWCDFPPLSHLDCIPTRSAVLYSMLTAKWLSPCLRALHNTYQKKPVLSDCIVGFGTFSLGEWVAQWYSSRHEHR